MSKLQINLIKYTDNNAYILRWWWRKDTIVYGYRRNGIYRDFVSGFDYSQLQADLCRSVIIGIETYRTRRKWTCTKGHPKWWLYSYLRTISLRLKMLYWLAQNANNLDKIAELSKRGN